MKELRVPAAAGFNEIANFASTQIDHVCWPAEFPYKPSVKLMLAHTSESILVRFDVCEDNAKAVTTESNGPVWEDSCVEFFVKVPGDTHYFNFETNCIGVGLAARRTGRSDASHFSEEQMSRIIHRSSLPLQPIDQHGDCKWSIELEVPFSSLGIEACPEYLEANFYKCGDKTEKTHFLSWNPVLTPTPDFHRPEYFGRLILEK